MGLYGNKFIEESFWNKKKNNNKQKDIMSDDIKKELKSTIEEIVNKYNKDAAIKRRIKTEIEDFYNNMDEKPEKTNVKLIADIFEDDDYSITFEICNEEQYICNAIVGILEDIIKETKAKINNPKLKFDTGDGDEGCIYVNII